MTTENKQSALDAELINDSVTEKEELVNKTESDKDTATENEQDAENNKQPKENDKESKAFDLVALDSNEIKEIAPELCDFGIQKFQEAKFTKEQADFCAKYLREHEQKEIEKEKVSKKEFAKMFNEEVLTSVSNHFNALKDDKDAASSFNALKTNKDFITLMSKYIANSSDTLVSSNKASNTKEHIRRQIQEIRKNPTLYNDSDPKKPQLLKQLDSLYVDLIK